MRDELPMTAAGMTGPESGDRLSFGAGVIACSLAYGLLLLHPSPYAIPLIAGLVAFGSDGVLRYHPRRAERDATQRIAQWMLPAVTCAAVALLSQVVTNTLWQRAIVLVGAGPLALALWAQYRSLDPGGTWLGMVFFLLTLLVNLVAFATFASVYYLEWPLYVSVPVVGIASGLLAASFLGHEVPSGSRAWLYSAIMGLLLAEIHWSLAFLPVGGLPAAVALLLTFYVLMGLVQHYLTERLSKALAAEYGSVAVAAVGLLYVSRLLTK